MTSRWTITTTALTASAIVASLLAAPTAAAQATCQEAGSIVRCETNGSVSIKAVPGTRAPNVVESIPRNNRTGIVLSW
ncbi:hypothetical protein Mycch_4188 [Mycolicibacterium chubuense NBB4]|uniref:Uncharacterized protein n=1 Tax=Mycolicibacterium chubuense (strain NBB4) TaxID=710421 RepID=I4BNP8_MYCCN|nr:hypothetical protein [Mycolicibacterium chubuense]AFM18905.1 hypothetical protein Mycch_4188 [Mycolicibacterium chubuense NBB4]